MSTNERPVVFTGDYLENIDPARSHNKFYLVLISEGNVVVKIYGRIGTTGQIDVLREETHARAIDVGRRQIYTKASAGYVRKHTDVKFEVPSGVLGTTIEQYAHNKTCETAERIPEVGKPMLDLFWNAVRNPTYNADREQVLRHYEAFTGKCRALLERIAVGKAGDDFSDLANELDLIKDAFDDIDKRHTEAKAMLSLSEGALKKAFKSGDLKVTRPVGFR